MTLRLPIRVCAWLYGRGWIGTGTAARWCRMHRVAFMMWLADHGRPMSNLRPEDLDEEADL